MRLLLAILPGLCVAIVPAAAQTPTQTQVVQKFDGTTSMTTPVFTVGDRWEVIWNSPAPLRITLLTKDGTIVAGAAGVFRGSLYEPKGGTFYLQIDGATAGTIPPWRLSVEELESNRSTAHSAMTYGGQGNFVLPTVRAPSPAPPEAEVAETPPAPPTPVPEAAAPPAPRLTEAQTRAVVMIEGDNADGAGLLVKMPDGPAVLTNLHILASNPNVRILTDTGAQITTLGLKGASDRDLALLPIKDDHYDYLELDAKVGDNLHPGDDVIAPDGSQGREAAAGTPGTVTEVDPDRIDFTDPLYHGNDGGPLFDAKAARVLGVVTGAAKVNPSHEHDRSAGNHDSSAANTTRYFALRIDTVPKWETYDPMQFQTQAAFLDQFHKQSRQLDSYLNSSSYRHHTESNADDEGGPPFSTLYLTDDKIVKAHTEFMQQATGGDNAERLDALRAWLFTMDNIADSNVPDIQNLDNFYGYYKLRALQEMAYRQTLKKELDSYGDNISRAESLGHHK